MREAERSETVASDMEVVSLMRMGPLVGSDGRRLRAAEESAHSGARGPGGVPGGRLPRVQRHIRRLDMPHIIDCGA
ncbi:hypothetical protein D1781_00135 [Amnibacterium setariae]|uniref:Uncharacterized protein n=1 Tax=Amnibacterium setariae TaxID=2306585 RepID=A0A3A1U0S0_9MICO|nr:hypothetical protein D1781_00135 [Amnibacterium setariae]